VVRVRHLILLALVFSLCQCSATAHKRSFGETVDDNVIAVKLKHRFVSDKVIEHSHIKLKVWKSVVTLTGAVRSQKQINRAIELSEQQPGVKEVKAYLVLKGMTPKKKKKEKKKISSFFKKLKPKKTKKSQVIVEDLPKEEKENIVKKDNNTDNTYEDLEY